MQNASRTGGRRSRRWTLGLLAAGCVFLAAGLVLGVADNPPGLALAYLAVSAWILAFAHRWRRVKSFLLLLAASLVGFPVLVVLHNLFYALAEMAAGIAGLRQVLGFLEVVFFLLAVLVCPPGVLIGALGSGLSALRRRRSGGNPGEHS
jgi:hypothetical protein